MTKRVLGVLAALAMMGGSAVACSSSSTPGPVQPTDGGTDTKTDARTDTRPNPVDAESGPPACEDKTTGTECMTNEDCDKCGEGRGFCTNKAFIVSPYNPTSVCVQFDTSGGDVCDVGDGTKVPLCDGNTGLCTKSGMNPATCDPICVLKGDGTFDTPCVGKNACNPEMLGTNTDGTASLIGTCQGGCTQDSDCPAPSVCDPLYNFCTSKTCTVGAAGDTACSKTFSTPNPAFKCVADTTGGTAGHCKFSFPKAPGERCTPAATASSTSSDCLCFGKTGAGADQGMCISICKTAAFGAANPECPTGLTCDPLLNAKDSMGKDIYAADFKLPVGIAGYCVKTCTADADCGITGWTCEQSAGVSGKTCRPPADM